MFTVNHDEAAQGNTLIAEGEYEVILKAPHEDATKAGTPYLNIPMVIRNDIAQKYQNAYIWHAIWLKKEPTKEDEACGGYSSKRIQSLSKAAGLPNGKQYKNLSDWMQDLHQKMVRVTVKHEEYNGNMQVRVGYIHETKYPQCNHTWKQAVENTVCQQDDLPF